MGMSDSVFTKLKKVGFKGETQAFAVIELPQKINSKLHILKFIEMVVTYWNTSAIRLLYTG